MHDRVSNWRLLLFGASGAIGNAVLTEAQARGWHVTAVSRGQRAEGDGFAWRRHDPLADDGAAFADDEAFDAVCWAHGANLTDSVKRFDIDQHLHLYRANCLSVMASMALLVERGLLRSGGARLVVVSSIWQERARGDKLSYIVSKAAVGGLVRSASVDLGGDGHLVNGVLPGALDTPMTHANLSAGQIAAIAAKTAHGRLPDLGTLAATICFLASADNKSISGQSVAIDLGMTNANLL